MAKRWIVLLLAVAVALAVVPLAVAGNGGGGDRGKGKLKFNLVGTVSAVNDVSSETTLTVYVKAGNKPVKKFRRGELELVVAEGARVRLVKIGEGCVDGTLADLVQGMKVKVHGRIDRTTDPATFIAVWVKAKKMPTPEP